MFLGGVTLEELRQILSEAWDKICDEYGLKNPSKPKEMRATEQRLASLKQEAWHPRLATKVDVPTDTKTRERIENAAAVQAKHGDSCSAKQVQAGPTSSTSFGMKLNLPFSTAGMTSRSTKAMRRQSRVSHAWRCAR